MASHRLNKGFGIRQAVIVFATLAVIAALLLPVFRPARENSPNPPARCASNLKQLGLALVQYEQDADSLTPPGVNADGSGWAGQIYPFAKSTGIYRCPDDAHDGSYVSYTGNRVTAKLSSAKFADASGTIQLYEATTLNCDPSTLETVSATGLAAPQDSTRHDPQTFALNFLAADGHVKMLKPGQVSSGPNAVSPQKRGAFVMTFAVK